MLRCVCSAILFFFFLNFTWGYHAYGIICITLVFSVIPLFIAHGFTSKMRLNMFVIWYFLLASWDLHCFSLCSFFSHTCFIYFKLENLWLAWVRLEREWKSPHWNHVLESSISLWGIAVSFKDLMELLNMVGWLNLRSGMPRRAHTFHMDWNGRADIIKMFSWERT